MAIKFSKEKIEIDNCCSCACWTGFVAFISFFILFMFIAAQLVPAIPWVLIDIVLLFTAIILLRYDDHSKMQEFRRQTSDGGGDYAPISVVVDDLNDD